MPSFRSRRPLLILACGLAAAALVVLRGGVRATDTAPQEPLEPFIGITTDSVVRDGLFAVRSTGVSTAPVVTAATHFLGGLDAPQRERTMFAVDSDEWRRWTNVHRAPRAGVSFAEMNDAQRELAIGLLRASLSAKGLELSRNIMRLNGHLADLLDNHEAYGEHLYWLIVFGEPSATEPWGWQLEGHHLIINYFVLGDQVVMTPTFWGSEPVRAESGPHAGIAVLQDEQDKGLAMIRSLRDEQRAAAVIAESKPGNNALAQAYRDNLVLEFAGIRATELDDNQRLALLDLIYEFVRNLREGHARIRMDEVQAHIDETWFAWIGEITDDGVFYFRIQSPVILIEFDHQLPVALRGDGARVPTRAHIHSVVRTPNAGDYGKDLLRQHYEQHRHDTAHGHVH